MSDAASFCSSSRGGNDVQTKVQQRKDRMIALQHGVLTNFISSQGVDTFAFFGALDDKIKKLFAYLNTELGRRRFKEISSKTQAIQSNALAWLAWLSMCVLCQLGANNCARTLPSKCFQMHQSTVNNQYKVGQDLNALKSKFICFCEVCNQADLSALQPNIKINMHDHSEEIMRIIKADFDNASKVPTPSTHSHESRKKPVMHRFQRDEFKAREDAAALPQDSILSFTFIMEQHFPGCTMPSKASDTTSFSKQISLFMKNKNKNRAYPKDTQQLLTGLFYFTGHAQSLPERLDLLSNIDHKIAPYKPFVFLNDFLEKMLHQCIGLPVRHTLTIACQLDGLRLSCKKKEEGYDYVSESGHGKTGPGAYIQLKGNKTPYDKAHWTDTSLGDVTVTFVQAAQVLSQRALVLKTRDEDWFKNIRARHEANLKRALKQKFVKGATEAWSLAGEGGKNGSKHAPCRHQLCYWNFAQFDIQLSPEELEFEEDDLPPFRAALYPVTDRNDGVFEKIGATIIKLCPRVVEVISATPGQWYAANTDGGAHASIFVHNPVDVTQDQLIELELIFSACLRVHQRKAK